MSARVLGVMLVIVLVSSAHAQRSNVARARRLFAEGLQLLESGRAPEARERFRASMAASPNAGTAFNLGMALRGTGEVLGALDVFERLLQEEFGALDPEQRGELSALVRALRGDVAHLDVEVEGTDLRLRVDGELTAIEAGRATLELDPGRHRLTVDSRSYEPIARDVTLAPGERGTVRLAPALRRGTLVVRGAAPEDQITVEGIGRELGEFRRELEPGNYRVRVRGENGQQRESEVEVAPGALVRVQLDPGSRERRLLRNPWIWIATGVLVTGAALSIGLFARERVADPLRDPYYGVVETLRRGP